MGTSQVADLCKTSSITDNVQLQNHLVGSQKCKSCVYIKEKTGPLGRRKLGVNYLNERGLSRGRLGKDRER